MSTKDQRVAIDITEGVAEVVTIMANGNTRRMTGVAITPQQLREADYDEETLIAVLRAMELAQMHNESNPRKQLYASCTSEWLATGPFRVTFS